MHAPRILCLAVAAMGLSACGRTLPRYERPIARAQFQHVRTTAYTHSESDHIVHGHLTSLGTQLRSGSVTSAAADWSRWPAGTVFRIVGTGQTFQVDDIGWALSGRNTIDLYKTSRSAMNEWGMRTVDIEVIQWGDDERSRNLLAKRRKFAHCRRMLNDVEKRIASGATNPSLAPAEAAQPASLVAASLPVSRDSSVPMKNFATQRDATR